LGEETGWLVTFWAFLVGHLGKYVPGKAMVVVLRAGLLGSERVPIGKAVVSVFVETLTLMSVGACWAAVCSIAVLPGRPEFAAGAVLMAILAGLPTCPPIARAMIRTVARLKSLSPRQNELGIDWSIDGITGRVLVTGWFAGSWSWFLCAFSLWAAVRSLGVDTLYAFRDLPLTMAVVTLSVVAGFVSFLPGGLGVRDALVVVLLAPTIGEASALMAAVVLRLVWIMSEVAASVMLYGAVRVACRRKC
jgi:uncharacterized membrane protein YbhN (UPF0104 family)